MAFINAKCYFNKLEYSHAMLVVYCKFLFCRVVNPDPDISIRSVSVFLTGRIRSKHKEPDPNVSPRIKITLTIFERQMVKYSMCISGFPPDIVCS